MPFPQPVPTVTVTFTIVDGGIDRQSVQFERGTPVALQQCVKGQLGLARFTRARNPTTLTRTFPVM